MATPSLLPAGPLFTSGNQIVDGSGNPVRIACVGWSGMYDRNGVPDGLYAANYQSILNGIKAIGFNCIRIGFADALVIANDYPASGYINYSLNSDLNGLSSMQVLDRIITYCGTIGLRVILDSHNNEGANNQNYGANQPNGLWYDSGGGSDGTDQGGNRGTVTDAAFQANWVAIANRYKNYPAILGYDLRNEPNTTGMNGPGNGGGCTWGDGGNRDIRAMYQRVGNAILAVDPRPLIICEGPQNYNGTFATGTTADGIAYGAGTTFRATCGDLTGARTAPVVLTAQNKVLYSVHEYPPETSGNSADAASQTKINTMTAVWGWMVKNAAGAVFLGEMGSYFNGTPAQIQQSTAWMNMMISYLNGHAAGGPSFSGAQQGISFDWWNVDVDNTGGGVPDFGIFTDWNSLAARQNQFTLYSQLFYYGGSSVPQPPTGGGTVTPSANGTTVTTVGPAITDVNGNTWTLTASGQVAVNGTADPTTANVIELAYVSGLVWQENASNLWWSKSTPADTWSPTDGTAASPLTGSAPVASSNGTIVTTVGPAITDANGNNWTLTAAGRAAVNGTADLTLSGVVELAYVGGQIWALTSANLWYYKTVPANAWAPPAGTATSPLQSGTPRVTPPLSGTVTRGTWIAKDITVVGVSLPSGKQVHFEILLPAQYSPSVVYPVVIWLHPDQEGNDWYSGANSNPNYLSAYDADGYYNTVDFRTNFPAIVIVGYADQTTASDEIQNWGGWVNTGGTGSGTSFNGETGPNVFGLLGVVQYVVATYAADTSRIYIEGFSLGAIGAEYLMLRFNALNGSPPVFAAAMSVAGVVEIHGYGAGPSANDIAALTHVPLWCVSGAQDNTSLPGDWNLPLWRALAGNSNYPKPGGTAAQALAGSSQYHLWYDPNIGHQPTDQAGNPYPVNATILNWLFSQSAGNTPAAPGGGTGGGGGSSGGTAIAAARTEDLLGIWGICGQVASFSTLYIDGNTPAQVVQDAQFIGARRWRDGIASYDSDTGGYDALLSVQTNVLQALVTAGIKLIGYPPNSGSLTPITYTLSSLITAAKVFAGFGPAALLALEGPNEPVNFPITYGGSTGGGSGTFLPVGKFQRDWYAAIKADPTLGSIPVWSATQVGGETDNVGLQYLKIPAGLGLTMPAGTVYADALNMHTYTVFDGQVQAATLTKDGLSVQLQSDFVSTYAHGYPGYTLSAATALPRVITEYGYATNIGSNSVDAATQAKNLLTALCQVWLEGYTALTGYELYDEGDGYGLFSAPGTPRLAATYLHNFTAILGDTATNRATFAPGSLAVTVTNLPASGQWKLLQKASGIFDVLLWNNVANYNLTTQAEIVVAATTVTVAFGSAGQIAVFDPTTGTTAITTIAAAATVNIALADYPVIVQFTPSTTTGTTPPPTGPVGTTWNTHPGITAWAASSAVSVGTVRSNNGAAYRCVVAGTTAASGGPTGTAANITDGTAHWAWLSTIDFFSLSGAATALPATFTAPLTLQFWNETTEQTAGGVPFFALSGHTMGAYSLTLTAAPGQGIRDFLAAQANPLHISASGVLFLQPTAANAAINYNVFADPVVTLDGLQFQDPSGSSGSTIIQVNTGTQTFTVRNTVIDGFSQPNGANMIEFDAGTILFTNCLIIDRQAASGSAPTMNVNAGVTAVRFVNCTFIATNAPSAPVIGSNGFTGSGTFTNCAFFGYPNSFLSGFTFDHCATSAAGFGSGTVGAGNLTGLSAAAQFVNPASDWRLLPTSALINTATTALTDIPTADDISRSPRPQGPAWDIGCWELQAFGPAEFRPPPIKFW